MDDGSARSNLLASRWPALTWLRTLPLRARELVRRSGLPDALIIAASTVLAALSRGACRIERFYVVVQPTTAPVLDSRPGRGSMSIRAATHADVTAGLFPRPDSELQERFDAGSTCLLVESKGSLLGFIWLQPGCFVDPAVAIRFVTLPSAESVWDYDVYIVPSQRNGLAFFRLWQAACQHLRAQGIRWSVSQIAARNAESLRAHLALGAQVVGSMLQVHVGRLIVSASLRPARFFITWPGRAEPVLPVDAAAVAPLRFARFAGSSRS